jgi:HSP20 family protein
MASARRGLKTGLVGLHSELEKIIDDVFGRGASGGPTSSWSPPADVFVAGNKVVVRFDVAGVPRDEINLTYAEGELRVRGVRVEHGDEQKDTYWQMEIPHGPFERRVKIPVPVDADRIEAASRDGILEARLPIVKRDGTE